MHPPIGVARVNFHKNNPFLRSCIGAAILGYELIERLLFCWYLSLATSNGLLKSLFCILSRCNGAAIPGYDDY